jgi:hypothetical protein
MFTYLNKQKFVFTLYVIKDSLLKKTSYILNNNSLLYEKENENYHHRFVRQKEVLKK